MTKAPPLPPNVKSLSPRRRRLSDDEIDLWLSVAASVSRRKGSAVPVRDPGPPVLEHFSPTETAIVSVAVTPIAAKSPQKPRHPPLAPLERRLKQKLSRGRMSADAAIDLHGFRQGEAYSALHQFLKRTQGQGARIVLVVTGKGGRPGSFLDLEGGDVGVLKRSVPLWLNMPDFRPMVVGFEEAARQHGGSGALYVRLRRRDRPGQDT